MSNLVAQALDSRIRHNPSRRPRVALVCDFVEEGWASMDLVADELFRNLQQAHFAEFSSEQQRTPMKRRFQRMTFLGQPSLLHNADRFVGRYVDYPRWLQRRAHEYDLFHILDHSYAHLV